MKEYQLQQQQNFRKQMMEQSKKQSAPKQIQQTTITTTNVESSTSGEQVKKATNPVASYNTQSSNNEDTQQVLASAKLVASYNAQQFATINEEPAENNSSQTLKQSAAVQPSSNSVANNLNVSKLSAQGLPVNTTSQTVSQTQLGASKQSNVDNGISNKTSNYQSYPLESTDNVRLGNLYQSSPTKSLNPIGSNYYFGGQDTQQTNSNQTTELPKKFGMNINKLNNMMNTGLNIANAEINNAANIANGVNNATNIVNIETVKKATNIADTEANNAINIANTEVNDINQEATTVIGAETQFANTTNNALTTLKNFASTNNPVLQTANQGVKLGIQGIQTGQKVIGGVVTDSSPKKTGGLFGCFSKKQKSASPKKSALYSLPGDPSEYGIQTSQIKDSQASSQVIKQSTIQTSESPMKSSNTQKILAVLSTENDAGIDMIELSKYAKEHNAPISEILNNYFSIDGIAEEFIDAHTIQLAGEISNS